MMARIDKWIAVRIKASADGPMMGHRVSITDAETDAPIENVTSITVEIRPDDVVRARLEVLPTELDIRGALAHVVTVCPACRKEVTP